MPKGPLPFPFTFTFFISGGVCDFEKDTCSWSNTQQGDDFDWLRSKGVTGTSFTGPSVDHTKGTSQGYYMYIETSAPRVAGDKARLLSQVYPSSGTAKCFSFYYHMYGSDVGSLNVYLLLNQSSDTFSTESLMWNLNGNWGRTWSLGQFPIPTKYTSYPYEVSVDHSFCKSLHTKYKWAKLFTINFDLFANNN